MFSADVFLPRTGVDLCEISRLKTAIDKNARLGQKMFSPAELRLPVPSLATRWALKEAAAKALGTPLGWSGRDICLSLNNVASEKYELTLKDIPWTISVYGTPGIEISGELARTIWQEKLVSLSFSLSHEKEIAAALVVFA